jgi:hypothetical protein
MSVSFQVKLDKEGGIGKVMFVAHPRTGKERQ